MSTDTQDSQIVHGIVTEALPNAHFRVQLEPISTTDDTSDSDDIDNAVSSNPDEIEKQEPEEILAYLAGKMRLHRIRVLVGDTVEVTLDQYGGKARIVRRL